MKHTVLLLTIMLVFAQQAAAQKSMTRQRLVGPDVPTTSTHTTDPSRGAAPANDDCVNAEVITIGVDCATAITGDNSEATQDGGTPLCEAGGNYIDVWYTLNPGVEDPVSIKLTPADFDAQDWNFAVYDACGGDETFCIINPAVAQNVPVTPNVDNWIRVWANTAYAPGGPFTLCVTPAVNIPVPPNDLCSDAIVQSVTIGSSTVFTGTNLGAMDNENEGVPCVWEAFTIADCADVHISYCGTETPYEHFMFPLYSNCAFTDRHLPGSYTQCADGNFILCYSGLPAGTYHYPILQVDGSVGPYTLTISAEVCGTDAPTNDECEGAIALTAGSTCTPQTFVPSCASESMAAITCDNSLGIANDDVWYSFVATQGEMSIGVLPHGDMDPAIQVFSGSCGTLAPFDCVDVNGSGEPDDLQMTGLTAGNTYHLRVYDFRANYAWMDPSYDLCIVEGLGSGVGTGTLDHNEEGALYPNPNDGDFAVKGLPGKRAVVSIIDATGRTVLQRAVMADASGNIRMNERGQLHPGAYTVTTNAGTQPGTYRLIIH